MSAGGGDCHRALRHLLAFDIGVVNQVFAELRDGFIPEKGVGGMSS